MEHLSDTDAMHKIFEAAIGEPQQVVEIVRDAITEKTTHMLNQMFHPPRPDSPNSPRIQPYQLFHPETLPMEVREKRADGYLELLSIVCKAEEMEIDRLAQGEQERIQNEQPLQEQPAFPEEQDEEVFLPDIEEPIMPRIEDGVQPMEIN